MTSAAFVGLAATPLVSTCSPPPPVTQSWVNALPRERGTRPLETNPVSLDLGVLKPGAQAESAVELYNPGPARLVVDGIETSCECLTVAPAFLRLGPGETERLTVRFIPDAEEKFRGALAVVVTGVGERGRVIFRTRVELEVRDGSAEGVAIGPSEQRAAAVSR